MTVHFLSHRAHNSHFLSVDVEVKKDALICFIIRMIIYQFKDLTMIMNLGGDLLHDQNDLLHDVFHDQDDLSHDQDEVPHSCFYASPSMMYSRTIMYSITYSLMYSMIRTIIYSITYSLMYSMNRTMM
jgi:hypothetical protein